MHFGCYRQPAFLIALFTERMRMKEPGTDLAPLVAIAFLAFLVPAVLLIGFVHHVLMLRTVTAIGQLRTAWVLARLLWTSWHTIHLHFRHAKSPRGIAPRGLVLYPFLVEYIISQQLD